MKLNWRNWFSRDVLLAVALVVMVVSQAAMVGAADSGTGLDTEAETTPSPQLRGTAEFVEHNMSRTVLDYQDDNGNWDRLNGSVANVTNPVSFRPDKVELDDFGRYPSEQTSTLNPANYTTSSATGATLNLTQTSGDITRLGFETSGLVSGDTATATFSDVSITSDVGKRIFWATVTADEVGGTADLVLVDGDGDEKRLHINSSASSNASDVLADGTGVHVSQQKLMDLATDGAGDGTFDSISKLKIVAYDGDVDLQFTTLQFDRLSKVQYGTQARNIDSDNETEQVDIYEPEGRVNITSVASLPTVFDTAYIHDLQVEYVQKASAANVKYAFEEEPAEEYKWDLAFESYYSFTFPGAADVSLKNARLTDTVVLPTGRLLSAKYIEGAGSSSYSELEDSNAWNSQVAEFENAGNNGTVTIDATIQEGTRYVLYQQWLVDGDDKSAMIVEGGGAGGPLKSKNLIQTIFSPIGGFFGSIVAFFLAILRGGDGE